MKSLLLCCLVFFTICLNASQAQPLEDYQYDVESILSIANKANCNGTIPITMDAIRVSSGRKDMGGKNCIFPTFKSASPAAKTLKNKLNSYFIYEQAKDSDFNKGDDQYYDASDYYVYSRSYMTMNNDYFLSGVVIGESYTGGAHPIHENLTFLIRTDTGEEVTIRDLVREDAYNELMSRTYKMYLAIHYIHKKFESVAEDYRLRKEELFSFGKSNDKLDSFFGHIFVTKDLLIIYIPYYEFGAYYEGDCYVPVSIHQIRGILTPLGKKLLINK